MAATYLLDVALEGMFGQKRFGTGLARIHFATLSRGPIGFHVGSSAGRIGRNIRLACERKRADNHLSIGKVLGPNSYFSRNFSIYFSYILQHLLQLHTSSLYNLSRRVFAYCIPSLNCRTDFGDIWYEADSCQTSGINRSTFLIFDP